MKFKNVIDCGLLILIGLHFQAQPVVGGTVTFTIDPTRSSITLSGSLTAAALGTLPLAAQGTGSLTATHTGSILVDLAPPYIGFPGGSVILANTNGNWQPTNGGATGTAPADYGAKVVSPEVITAYFADRNLAYDATSALAILTNGGINANLLTISSLTNINPAPVRDYNITVPLEPTHNTNGQYLLNGSTTNDPNTAYLTNTGGKLTLIVPISITNVSVKSGYTITNILKGTVTATAPATAWPLSLTAGLQNGQLTLTWPSFPGPTFTLQTTQTLGTNWTTAAGGTTVGANTTTWTAPPPTLVNTIVFMRLFKFKSFIDCGVLVLIGLLLQAWPVAAGQVTFAIDPTRSIISLSGNLQVGALGTRPITAQGAGSLTTSYTGSILADLTPPFIDFPGGSMIQANTNGSWKPDIGGGSGSAPADYGGEVLDSPFINAYFSGRNFLLDVASPQTTLTNGGFDSGLLAVTFLTNTTPAPGTDFSVNIPLDPSENTNGSSPLTGTSTNGPNTAYLTNSGGRLALFMPVSITNVMTNGSDVITVILTGTVVATAPASAWPLPLSAGLQNGQVTLTWPSFPGPTFTVQTTQVLGTNWTTATGVTTVGANTTTWTGAATNTSQFYRIRASF